MRLAWHGDRVHSLNRLARYGCGIVKKEYSGRYRSGHAARALGIISLVTLG